MTNELATTGADTTVALPDDLKGMLNNQSWIGYIKQWSSQAAEVMKKEKVGGDYTLMVSKTEQIGLGAEFDCFICAYRSKAIDFRGDTPVSYYDVKQKEFIELKERAEKLKLDAGCQYGADYLLWIPKIEKFATMLLGSWSARKNAGEAMFRLINRWATIKQFLDENSKGNTWWSSHAIPLTVAGTPYPLEEYEQRLQAFKNPKAGPEEAPVGEQRDR